MATPVESLEFGQIGEPTSTTSASTDGRWHTFWNAGDQPARILEIISRAGFVRFFEELTELAHDGGPPDPATMAALAARCGAELDFESVPRLIEEYGVSFGPEA